MSKNNEIIDSLPLLPVRDLVLFPGMLAPLSVGRRKSLNAVKSAVESESRIVVATQKEAQKENPSLHDLYETAVIASIVQIFNLPEGGLRILVEGDERVRITSLDQFGDSNNAYFEKLEEIISYKDESYIKALSRQLLEKFEEYSLLSPGAEMTSYSSLDEIDDPVRITDTVSSQIKMNKSQAYRLLKELNPVKRLERLTDILLKEIEILSIKRDLEGKVQGQIEKSQKEYYLAEQMKVIKKELGAKDVQNEEYFEFKDKIRAASMPKDAKKHAEKELDRLKKMMPFSPESTVVRTYLEWMLKVPWKRCTEDKFNIKKARRILTEEHYGLEDAKERIVEYLAVAKLSKHMKTPIICFLGPPGTGKTSFAKSIAEALSRKFVRISLGGIRDEAEIRGHRRTYIGSMPGRIIQSVIKSGVKNPVFLLDEVDKMGSDFRGDPSSALLEALDPEQNNSFSDHYLEVEYDLSKVMFITTANSIDTIPHALLDRMEIIEFSGYTLDDKIEIAKRYLIPKQLKENGLKSSSVSMPAPVLRYIIENYTRESGVRNIEREISKILRKVAVNISEGMKVPEKLRITDLSKYLGVEKFSNVRAQLNDVGVAAGLAYTPNGGESLSIEVSLMPGTGELKLTGTLGDVMKESAQTALSFVRANASELNIPMDFYKDKDIHIHVPSGAVPKEGPSAGITICTALMSVLKSLPVKKEVVMTGELTLSGRVLEIGGLKEKVLAAHRDGFKTVIFPSENKKNLSEVPEKIRNKIKLVPVDNYKEVIKYVF